MAFRNATASDVHAAELLITKTKLKLIHVEFHDIYHGIK
jgi:hypothetical protein